MTGTTNQPPSTLLLRRWEPRDAAALVAAYRSSGDLATQFPADPGGLDEQRATAVIEESLPFDDRSKHWAIVQAGVAVGTVGLAAIEFRHGTAWASYWLADRARGRGTASRALATVATRAFTAGLHRLELGHRVNNPASCRVAAAAGFAAEGIERQKLRYGTERFDVETHARLATDPTPDLAPIDVAEDAQWN